MPAFLAKDVDDVATAQSLMTPAAIREVSLPRSLRGFDEAATRKFLIDVAETVQKLLDQADKLQRSLDEMNEQRLVDPEDPATIGNVLLAAQRAGEELVAHARATASQMIAEAREASERRLEEALRSAADAEQQFVERRAANELRACQSSRRA